MPIELTMPRLSDTMQAGTVVRWSVKEGQKVRSGDVVADIETDKATMELQTFDEGVVAELAVPEGQNVPVGTVIMRLAAAGEDPAAVRKAGAAAPARAAQVSGAAAAGPPAAGGGSATATLERAAANGEPAVAEGERVFASPLARKIAAESGIDLKAVEGTGPSGRITRRDVEAAAGGRMTAPESRPTETALESRPTRTAPGVRPTRAAQEGRPATRLVPLSNMRRTIARRLVESKTTIPHYQVTVTADMEPLHTLREQLNAQLAAQGVKLSVNDFIVRACALAMREHPYVNARWVEKGAEAAVEFVGEVNIGIAIALPVAEDGTGGGLVVATLRDADAMGLRQVSAESRRLSEKARTKGLTIEEMEGSTFTISNLGMFGVEHFTAIINPPNAAILAVGAAVDKPVVRNGQVVPGREMQMTMSSDHRVIDGAMAARYLATVKQLLEAPATLLV